MNNFLGNYNISILIPEEIEILYRLVILKFSQSSHSCPPPTKRKHRKGIKLSQFRGKNPASSSKCGRCPHCSTILERAEGGKLLERALYRQQPLRGPHLGCMCACAHVHKLQTSHGAWKEIGHQHTPHAGRVLQEGSGLILGYEIIAYLLYIG